MARMVCTNRWKLYSTILLFTLFLICFSVVLVTVLMVVLVVPGINL